MSEWISASQMFCPYDNVRIKQGPNHPVRGPNHPVQQPRLEVAMSLSRDVSHPVLQRPVKRGSNVPHKSVNGRKDGNDDNRPKLGIAGTKLTIRLMFICYNYDVQCSRLTGGGGGG